MWYFGGSQAKFYIRANNATSVMLNPERAEYEFYTYDLPLGIQGSETPFEVGIFPNPTNGNISVNNPSGAQLNYSITNSFGTVVANGKLKANSIDLSGYASGMYFVEFTDDHERRLVKKLMVN